VSEVKLETIESILNAPPVIKLEAVNVEFNARAVLRNVSLSVAHGEFIAIIGPSGGGKSTLLRVIAGLLKARGTVQVEGQPAVVFQDYRLLPWRTVRQNVALPKELNSTGLAPDDVLQQVGMLEYANLYPHQLSGGMRARIAIARALAQNAEVILFDEPFAALDALVRERFNLETKKIHRKTGKTIVFVTHSIREAVYLADRVVVLKDGMIDTILETRGQGRITSFTEPLEAELRSRLGLGDSTFVEPTPKAVRFPWEILGILIVLNALLIAWNILVPESSYFFPSPGKVWRALLENHDNQFVTGTLETLRITGLGLLYSLGIGIPIGYAMGKLRVLERLLSPFVVALQAIPIVVITPLLVLGLGYGTSSRVLIATLISIFPVLISTMVGVREVDRVYTEVFKTIGSSTWGMLTKLEFPGALPVILSGLRSTASLALIGTVVAEFTLSAAPDHFGGLGYIVLNAKNQGRYDVSFASVFVLVSLGIGLYIIIAILERIALRYRRR
jgi:NitT/TauT family transport system ATP-binding protein